MPEFTLPPTPPNTSTVHYESKDPQQRIDRRFISAPSSLADIHDELTSFKEDVRRNSITTRQAITSLESTLKQELRLYREEQREQMEKIISLLSQLVSRNASP